MEVRVLRIADGVELRRDARGVEVMIAGSTQECDRGGGRAALIDRGIVATAQREGTTPTGGEREGREAEWGVSLFFTMSCQALMRYLDRL